MAGAGTGQLQPAVQPQGGQAGGQASSQPNSMQYSKAVMPSGYGAPASGGDSMGNAGNYWSQREAEVGPAQAFAEQSAQNQKINDALTSFSKAGFMSGLLGAISNPFSPSTPASNTQTYSPSGGDYSSFSGAGDAQTAASLSSDYNGGFYG